MANSWILVGDLDLVTVRGVSISIFWRMECKNGVCCLCSRKERVFTGIYALSKLLFPDLNGSRLAAFGMDMKS